MILDEINETSALTYTWTLDGLGSLTLSVPLENTKTNASNFNFKNHIEVIDENNNIIWCGQILTRDFSGPLLVAGAYGYLSLLSRRTVNNKAYASMNIGALCMSIISDVNVKYDTGITAGTVSTGAITTQLTTVDTDMALDKITSSAAVGNYDFEIDSNRKFNFYTKKGTDKSTKYTLEYGGVADNVLINPDLTQSFKDSANVIWAEIPTPALIASASNNDSISQYGREDEALIVASSVIDQTTLNACCNSELAKMAYATDTLTLKVRDSILCPFSDISLGDTVMVSLIPYWGFKQPLRIIEMTQDEATGQRDIVVGTCNYRTQRPVKKIYMR